MSWIKQKLKNWLFDEDTNSVKLSAVREVGIGTITHGRSPDATGIKFTIYPAVGGRILEMKTYDERKDTQHNKLYIIRDDQDLGKEIDHIITLECLRN